MVRPPIKHYTFARIAAQRALASIDALIAGAAPGEDVYIENAPFRAVGLFVLANPANFPGPAALFAVYHDSKSSAGIACTSWRAMPAVLDKAGNGIRSAPLLIDPDQAPADRVRRIAGASR